MEEYHGVRRPRAANNREEDAHLLYVMVFASSRLVSLLDGTHVYLWTTKRDDFFRRHVKRHCFPVALSHPTPFLKWISSLVFFSCRTD